MFRKDVRRPKSSRNFKNNEIIEIIVTYAKAPNEFYGVENHMWTEIQTIEDGMNTWYSEKRQTPELPYIPEIETICAALVQNRWHRARVMKYHGIDISDVYLIDSGEIVQLKLTNLRWLEDRFFRISCGASHFTLPKKLLGSSDQMAINKFEGISELKRVLVNIVHSSGSFPTNYAITLPAETPDTNRKMCISKFSATKNVDSDVDSYKNMIDNGGNFENSQEETSKRIVKMSYCISPNEFYLQFEDARDRLMQLQHELQRLQSQSNATASYQSKKRWIVGERCYVRTKTAVTLRDCWYRGEILDTCDNHWTVFLRDYGNIVCVTVPENLVSEREKFGTVENFAVRCSLASIVPTNGSEWSKAAIDEFHDLYQNYEQLAVTLQQKKSQSHSQLVILWGLESVKVSALKPTICEWTSINNEMVTQGLAQLNVKISAFDFNLKKHFVPENDVALADDAVCLQFTSWIVPKPITQRSFVCIPTYVSDELVIYFHDADEEETLESMRTTATEKFTKYKRKKDSNWTTNEPCMAKYTDGTYYRAEILTVNDNVATVSHGKFHWV